MMHRRYEPSHIPIEILRSFVSVLDTGSFTKAAARLNLTQPAISAQIKRMQTLVGEELFRKEGVGIKLTTKGETICRYARRILALNDQILWTGRSEKRLRVGLPSILGGLHLNEVKSALESDNFQSVQIVCDRSDRLLKQVGTGLLDVAIAFTASGDGELVPAAEWQEPLVWICHPDLVLSPGAPIPMIVWPDTVPDQIAVRACEQAQVGYRSEFVGDQLSVIVEALELKLGYFCLAKRAVPPGMKVSSDYFLPKLPSMHAGIYKNPDQTSAYLDAVIRSLSRVFEPTEPGKTGTDAVAARPLRKDSPVREDCQAESHEQRAGQRVYPRMTPSSNALPKQYREKANEARQLARTAGMGPKRDNLLNVAANYEHTAAQLEALSKSHAAVRN